MKPIWGCLGLLSLLLNAGGCGRAEFAGGSADRRGEPIVGPVGPTSDGTDPLPGGPLTGKPIDPGAPTTPGDNETEVVFGKDKVFHIGDDAFDDSSCLNTVSAYPTVGTTYFFEFEVLTDDTMVSIAVQTICGVDYNRSNKASILRDSDEIEAQVIPSGSLSLGFLPRAYPQGKYRLAISSQLGSLANPGDRDDFVVGNILIKADKRIVAGAISTE